MVVRMAQIATLVAGFGVSGSFASAQGEYRGNEIPAYTVDARLTDEIEVRAYAPQILAQVTVAGARNPALSKGFRTLAGYIFGGNQSRTTVSMTAPVTQTPSTVPRSERIAMTSPVGQTGGDGTWTVSFMMPSDYTLATLPVPNDPAIRLYEDPAHREVVIRFGGLANAARLDAQTRLLRDAAAGAGLATTGTPAHRYYDDPLTLPWNRRNEVALTLE